MSATVCSTSRRRVLAGALAPAFLVLASCGTAATQSAGPESSASTSPTPQLDLPACADVWVAGKQLPADYNGCQENGAAADDVRTSCAMGDALVQHGADLYASPGRQIRTAQGGFPADEAFQRIYDLCTG